MPKFIEFKKAVQIQFDKMSAVGLYQTDVNKEDLWETYLASFPEGTNKIFRERSFHDCTCCKQFIRACGSTVSIIDGKLVSIWDINIDNYYQDVADAMSTLVKSRSIRDIFLSGESKLGTDFNYQELESGMMTWNHFYYKLPDKYVKPKKDIGAALSIHNSNQGVFKRGLLEITLDAADIVIDLIDQGSIYRGEEFLPIVRKFVTSKREFDALGSDSEKDNYCWELSSTPGIRNTVIGTLLVDLSEDVDLTIAVKKFESKVAPENYKRPTALITKRMIDEAQDKVAGLGIESSLSRRYAVMPDITINNVIFADRSAQEVMNVFEEMNKEVEVNDKNLDKVEEVDIETFVSTILPKVDTVEILFENRHSNNLVSLIAPQDQEAKSIFKWDNNFSWAYTGEVADSIKDRVKKAGGNVNGVLRCSLSWFNYDDLDLHIVEPNKNHIYYSNSGRAHPSTGELDVDMNVSSGSGYSSRSAVENIVWTNELKMLEGEYEVYINNYTHRESIDVGFDVEIEYNGTIHSFHYAEEVLQDVPVAKFRFSRKDGIKFIKSIPSSKSTKEIWGVDTHRFQKVSVIMNSPNHWDGNSTGNKHYFFMMENCKNENQARGFFNEFLKEDLSEHRKVFEVLGSKMKTPRSDQQLSGLGFSSTKRSSILCKVSGSFNRTLQINF